MMVDCKDDLVDGAGLLARLGLDRLAVGECRASELMLQGDIRMLLEISEAGLLTVAAALPGEVTEYDDSLLAMSPADVVLGDARGGPPIHISADLGHIIVWADRLLETGDGAQVLALLDSVAAQASALAAARASHRTGAPAVSRTKPISLAKLRLNEVRRRRSMNQALCRVLWIDAQPSDADIGSAVLLSRLGAGFDVHTAAGLDCKEAREAHSEVIVVALGADAADAVLGWPALAVAAADAALVVLAPSLDDLKTVAGIGEAAAIDLKLLHEATLRAGREAIAHRPVISSWTALLGYVRVALANEPREQFRVLFLDKKNQLIADEVLNHGTVDHAPVYPREVMRRALELSSSNLILLHNHPSGDPTPSRPDIDMTRQIIEAGKALKITVHDHLVVGREGVASFKALGLF